MLPPFLNYSFVLLLVYSGIFIGIILGIIAREELKIAKWYRLFRYFLYLIIFFYFSMLLFQDPLFLVLFLLFIGITLFFAKIPDYYIYTLLAIPFYASSHYVSLFFAQSLFIFLLGMPLGTLYVYEHMQKKKKKIMVYKEHFLHINLRYGGFVLFALVLYWLHPFF